MKQINPRKHRPKRKNSRSKHSINVSIRLSKPSVSTNSFKIYPVSFYDFISLSSIMNLVGK